MMVLDLGAVSRLADRTRCADALIDNGAGRKPASSPGAGLEHKSLLEGL
jgi:hypothetical protein